MPREAYVYVIKNVVNDHRYVGKSINVKYRFKRHFKDAKANSSVALHCAMRKHGFDNFILESVEKFHSEDEAYENEAKTIQKLLSENAVLYNENSGGKGNYTPTDELRKKISDKVKEGLSKVDMDEVYARPEYRKNLSNAVKTYFVKEENRTAASDRAKQQWKKHRIKMMIAQANRKQRSMHTRNTFVIVLNDIQHLKRDYETFGKSETLAKWKISNTALRSICEHKHRRFVISCLGVILDHTNGVSHVDLVKKYIGENYKSSRTINRIIAKNIQPSPASIEYERWKELPL